MAGGFPYKLPFTLGFVAEPEPEATAWELALSRGEWCQHGDASGFV